MTPTRNISPAAYNSNAWYVAATHPRKECVAIENLHLQNFPTFFPRIPHLAAKLRGTRLAPLFPGYVFVSFDREAHRWQSINGTFGIRALVGGEGRGPSRVPNAAMKALFARCPQGIWESAPMCFTPGDAIEVVSGPFLGAPAQFEKFLPNERVRILLDWLNGTVPVNLPLEQIGKLN